MTANGDSGESRRGLYDAMYTDETLHSPFQLTSALVCAAALLPRDAGRVLDIGCGAGTFGRLLKARQAIHVSGVEFYEPAAAIAREYLDDVQAIDLDAESLPWPAQSFDAISCLDVLEHLVDPPATLAKLAPILKSDGWLICSVPNVLHQSVIWRLLVEREWGDDGVCDWRHLRFFTLSSLARTLQTGGFAIDAGMFGTTTALAPEMAKVVEAARALGGTDVIGNELEIFQYVLRARYVGGTPPLPSADVRKVPNTLGIGLEQALAILNR